MRAARAVGLALVLTVLASGCEDEPFVPPIEVTYDVAARSILSPFPSDRYTVADPASPTGLRVAIDRGSTTDTLVTSFPAMVSQLGELDGFSTIAGVAINFSGALDLRGLTVAPNADPPVLDPPRPPSAYESKDAPLALVDVDPSSPERGKLHPLVVRYFEQRAETGLAVDDTLVAAPAVPLRPRTRYLFVATRDLSARSGGKVQPSPEMLRLLGGPPADDYERKVDAALAVYEAVTGRPRKRLAVATVFTTESVTTDLERLARGARSRPPPAAAGPFVVERPLTGDGRVRFRASFHAPEYRRPGAGTFAVDPATGPVEQGQVPLEVFLTTTASTERRRRPVVLYQHGLGGDKDGTWGTAERLAELGVAVIGIDSPEHGSRSPVGARDQLASVTAFLGVDVEKKTFDIARARDNFRQMASDQLALVRFVSTLGGLDVLPAGAPDGEPDLDVTRVFYIGHSFGSVQGPTIFALAPEIRAAVWNVGGAGLTVLLRESPLFSFALRGLEPPGTAPGALARFFVVAQALVDPGDPAAYARYATLEPLPGLAPGPRDVLVQEAIDDNIVPNASTEVLARALGLAQARPARPVPGLRDLSYPVRGNLPGGGTGVLAQFSKMNGGATATHGELIFSPEARRQYVEFFRGAIADGRATAVAP
jgi:dienelactone hydrolase